MNEPNSPNWQCSSCHEYKTGRRYRRNGHQYCSICKRLEFHRANCRQCGKNALLLRDNPNGLCRKCEIADRVCIRCGRSNMNWGQVTKDGPVCPSCSYYFRNEKSCSRCGRLRKRVYRSPEYGIHELICDSCLNADIKFNCSACYQFRNGFICTLDRKVLCETCSILPDKSCQQCHKPMSAGRGKVCRDCSYRNRFLKRVAINKTALSPLWREYFSTYANWLLNHAGSLRASLLINQHWPFFRKLDRITQEIGQIPTHQELMRYMTVLEMRRSLLVTQFLDESNIITQDAQTKADAAEWDYMDRMKLRLATNKELESIFVGYRDYMLKRVETGKTSLRSVRLAMTPTTRLLELSGLMNKSLPDQSVLIQFLWQHAGQRAAISGFVNYLNDKHGTALVLPKKGEDIRLVLKHPKEGREKMLRKKLFDYLNSTSTDPRLPRMILRAALGYLHSVHLPKDIVIENFMWRPEADGSAVLMMGGWEFWLPKKVVETTHYQITRQN